MTQNERIYAYLRTGGKLTTASAARKFGVTRLACRIAELREAGVPVYNNNGVYQIGIPRAVIAKAYAQRGASIFA